MRCYLYMLSNFAKQICPTSFNKYWEVWLKQIQLSTFATNPSHCLKTSRTLERSRPKMSSPGDTKDDKQEIFDAICSSESSEDGEDTDEDTAEQEMDKEGGDKRGGAPPKKKKRKKLRWSHIMSAALTLPSWSGAPSTPATSSWASPPMPVAVASMSMILKTIEGIILERYKRRWKVAISRWEERYIWLFDRSLSLFLFRTSRKDITVKLARLFDYLNLDIEGGDVVDGRLGDCDGVVNDDDDLQDVLPPPHACRGTPVRLWLSGLLALSSLIGPHSLIWKWQHQLQCVLQVCCDNLFLRQRQGTRLRRRIPRW